MIDILYEEYIISDGLFERSVHFSITTPPDTGDYWSHIGQDQIKYPSKK